MYTKSIVFITLAYIHLSYCSTENDGRMHVVNKVKEVIQSVSGVGGPHNTAGSNSGYVNPVKPSVSGTEVPQPGPLTTTEPVITGGGSGPECPTQSVPDQTYQPDSCSCSYSVENFCQG